MANSQQSGSASQRRAKENQQRQRRNDARVTARNKSTNKGPMVRKKDRSTLYMVIGVLSLIAVIIVGFILLDHFTSTSSTTSHQRTAADQTVVDEITTVTPATWSAVGTGGVTNPFTAQKSQAILKGPNGHPELLYIGGEFCPYCAATRWSLINALSRFGTFNHLSQIQSYEDNISTFSFYGSSFSSQYVDFVPREIDGNALNSSSSAYVPLETLSSSETQIFSKFDGGQTFPFVDTANQYVALSAGYDPTILLDSSQNPLTWQSIASSLSDNKSTVSKDVLGMANYITATICQTTNQQPAAVCGNTAIQTIEKSLGQTSSIPGSNPLAVVHAELVAAFRQR